MVRAQGQQLSQLLGALGSGVPLYGVVHEAVDDQPAEFSSAAFDSKHDVLFDPDKAFFPLKNQGALGLLRLGTIMNTLRHVSLSTMAGNLKGDYSFHGGVLVIGPGSQGIVYQALEEDFGDLVDPAAIEAALARFVPVNTDIADSGNGGLPRVRH